MTAPDYSIVIPAYNEEALLPATLASVRSAMAGVATHRGEIVVTDNDSSDRTAEVAADAGARVVFEGQRQIARSRNTGGHFARGRYLVFVDADTVISARLLERTLAALDSGKLCGGGTTVRFDRDDQLVLALMLRIWILISRGFGWACGAYVFCLREAFLATGGFDERFYASEEIHFSRALKRWGRARGLGFAVLDEPIVTSARKLEWYTTRDLLRMAFRLLTRPSSWRSREGCEIWYARPLEKSDDHTRI